MVSGEGILVWPAQLPDINSIENLWTDIKEAVSKVKSKNHHKL